MSGVSGCCARILAGNENLLDSARCRTITAGSVSLAAAKARPHRFADDFVIPFRDEVLSAAARLDRSQ